MSIINIMALRHSAFYSPLLLTVAAGFLRQQGLEANYSLATPQKTIPDSIATGECHVAQSAVATGFAGLEKGEESSLVHFAQINERDGFFIATRQGEKDFSWHDLIGKTVLVDHFFQPMAMLKYALHLKGIKFNQLDVIDAGTVTEIDQAFREGQGDYVHQQGPAPQQLQQDGVGSVVASVGEVIGTVAFSSLCSNRTWLETDMAKAFMLAYRQALNFAINAPAEEIAAYEAEAGFFPGIGIGVLTQTIRDYQKLGCWQANPEITEAAYEKLLDIFEFSGLIKQRHAYETLIVKPPGS